MAPLRVAVIGLGVISRFYLAALRGSATLRLCAVCDRDADVLAGCGAAVPAFTDHRALLDRARPDAVVVTVPNDAHFQVCADALARGVAVCVEKPLALTGAEGERLLRLAERSGTPLFTAFHRRYNRAVLRLRDRLAGLPVERLTVRYLERIEEHAGRDTWYLDPRRCGGGCVADNGPNAFDLVDLLLGPPRVVAARIVRDRAGVDRQADIELRAGRTPVRVLLDWSYPGERKDIEVRLGDGRTLHADMLAGHPGFKASLWHEYAGVLDAFERRLRYGAAVPGRGPDRHDGHDGHGPRELDGGLAALRLVEDAYRLAGGEGGAAGEGGRAGRPERGADDLPARADDRPAGGPERATECGTDHSPERGTERGIEGGVERGTVCGTAPAPDGRPSGAARRGGDGDDGAGRDGGGAAA
jgi:Predicted dehydrogenases and related proteins